MAALNLQYILAGEPYKRYIKTVKHSISGIRIDPDTNKQVPFIIQTHHTGDFDYEREVLEIYSESEDKLLKVMNRYLFENGMLSIYNGEKTPIDETNILTDQEIDTIATTRTSSTLSTKLAAITSAVTIRRIYDAAKEIGRPEKILNIIKARLDDLSQN